MDVKLKGVMSPQVQSNIFIHGNKKAAHYELSLEQGRNDYSHTIRVLCDGTHLGYLPDKIVNKVARWMLSDEQHDVVAQFVKINKHPKYDTVGLTVKIRKVKKAGKQKMSDQEYIEAKEWQQKWIDRHGSSKWY